MKIFHEDKYNVVAHDIPVGLDANSYMKGAVMVLEMLDKEPNIVLCKDCIHYKKPHVRTPDGQEKSYGEMPEEAFMLLGDGGVTMVYGINVGGKCMLDCDRGYSEDKSVFRSPDDFCSYGCADA